MRAPAASAARIASGLGSAALWGVAVEAVCQAIAYADPLSRITRGARLERLLEMGVFAAGAALALALLCLVVAPLRRRIIAAPVWTLSTLGLSASLAVAIGFLWAPPPLEAIRLSPDPLRLRAIQLSVGTLVGTGVAFLGFAVGRRAWLVATQVVAAVLACFAAMLPGSSGSPAAERHPDVFLISIDTLRADHLGCYGYPLPTSPAIDALCKQAIVYDTAISAAPMTIPSYSSLMSGTLQETHGVYTNYDKASDDTLMLAERLRAAGYRTAALLEGTFPGSFANVGQGFDLLVQNGITAATPAPTPSEGLRSLARAAAYFVGERLRADLSVTSWVIRGWLHSLPGDAPVFAHFYWAYPHDPYVPPSRYMELVPPSDEVPEALRDRVHRYDAEIRFADTQVGAALDALREAGLFDDAWVIFTSDHGEELGRVVAQDDPAPFFGHARYLFDASVHVPLIIKPPRSLDWSPERVDEVVTSVSIASTLLDGLGIPGAEGLVGPLPRLAAGRKEAHGLAFSITRNPSRSFYRASVRKGAWRLIETRSEPPGVALLREEGVESEDLSAQQPRLTRELLGLLHSVHPLDASPSGDGHKPLSDRERQMLQDLGYVE
jgi:arylsulfatase